MQCANQIQARTNPPVAAPDWYELYFAAVLEPDEEKARITMQHAGGAIEDRLRQLTGSGPEHAEEIQDLNSALIYLNLLLQNMNIESGRFACH